VAQGENMQDRKWWVGYDVDWKSSAAFLGAEGEAHLFILDDGIREEKRTFGFSKDQVP